MLRSVCVKTCPYDEDKTALTVHLDCHTTTKTKSCDIEQKNYYELKHLFGRLCFPKSNDEIKYDPVNQHLAQIYDPNTGETFKKVVSKTDVKNPR